MFLKIGQPSDHGFDQPLGLLSDCHRRIEHFLSVLCTTADRARGGPLTPAEQRQLEDALRYFATAAPKHTADEEDSVFPRLRRANEPAALEALDTVRRLERDHQQANEHHAEIDRLGRLWLVRGALSAEDTGALRERLSRLAAIYRDHIRVEDQELFPAAARLLSAADLREIGGEMAARRQGPSRPPTGAPRS
jgi:hemerythrin-like domain-containing protein